MPRNAILLLLLLLAAACSARDVANTVRAACRGSPAHCTDPDQSPLARSPGM
ncbi:hypothetical protein [Falsiroseomonas selenitidurans]|uniref:Lipoprotein n=1 Tax=Falsiroseomonas selenitidurans TaxID=2716335 RepID=A0ABX1DYS7_9PROT|nr:hypothetical protein [Falsiroseomonas selenitidurans]NKC30026.1 hypothetical protein [Falsiroseomonas selenitidurans]